VETSTLDDFTDHPGTNTKLPHEFLVATGQQLLIEDGINAQKGSRAAASSLLETVGWLKSESILEEVLEGMEKSDLAEIERAGDGSPAEINFSSPIPGYPIYPKIDIAVDIKQGKVNGKDGNRLKIEADAERKEFVDALIDAANRKLPDGEKTPLIASEKKLLKIIEEGLIAGQLKPLQQAFQSSYEDGVVWSRMSSEIEMDINSPAALKLNQNGASITSLEIVGENDQSLDSIFIPARGKAEVRDSDGNHLSVSTEEVMARQTMYRLGFIDRKQSDYRCDFDAHERANSAPPGRVSLRDTVEKFNTYKKHLCGDESVD
jgi:hypothetical protein